MLLSDVGILLINLGTPAGPDVRNVRRYLRQFLTDPKVITIPAILRWLLVNLIIIPTRAKKSAHAYSMIWQKEGSPLLINSQKLCANLNLEYPVVLGMRYGKPSIAQALIQLNNVKKIIVLPLFPQYSVAATGSALAEVQKIVKRTSADMQLEIISDFYNDPNYIDAMARSIAPYLTDPDFLLFSYHGLPERQAGNYAEHCRITSKLIAEKLNLPADKWCVSFQSRLGRLPWIKPYTDEILPQLYGQGVRKLVIACPSFVADCLETLEEIDIRAREQWLQFPGTSLTRVPCLNGEAGWLKELIQSRCAQLL